MKNIFIVLILLSPSFCIAQKLNFSFPDIHKKGGNIAAFVPKDWEVRDSIFADLNNDHFTDLALVIQTKTALVINDTDCFSNQPFYPKMLIIAFGQQDGSFKLSTTATKLFGTCNWGVQGLDPYMKLESRRNSLGITFLTGGTNRNWFTYYFKYQNNDWWMIGADALQYWAGHTDGKDAFFNQSINLVTGEKETYYEDENMKQNSYKKIKIKIKPLVKLTSFYDDSFIPFDEY